MVVLVVQASDHHITYISVAAVTVVMVVMVVDLKLTVVAEVALEDILVTVVKALALAPVTLVLAVAAVVAVLEVLQATLLLVLPVAAVLVFTVRVKVAQEVQLISAVVVDPGAEMGLVAVLATAVYTAVAAAVETNKQITSTVVMALKVL